MKCFTDNVGVPVQNDFSSLTVGENGPILMQDTYLMEKIASFNREVTIPRRVHTKGSGAFGYFEVTNNVTKYTCADFLSCVGKKTDLVARFSQAVSKRGMMDTTRDIRGFALKFYTNEGNYDLLSISVPVFFFSDILKFPDFVHSQEPLPNSNVKDANTVWDYLSLTPESIHATTILFADRGIPASYRHMNSFGPNTFVWYNKNGERFLVKYHIKTMQGVKNLSDKEGAKIGGENPEYLIQDLYDNIEKCNYPEWKMYVQIMPEKDAKRYMFDPYDVTQVWFHKDYPLIEVGKIVLNRNPIDFFNEMEQLAFQPNHFVPGIAASNDRLLQGRLFVYQDAQHYRIGINQSQLPVNKPIVPVNNFERNGNMNVSCNGAGMPNYNPNSFISLANCNRCKTPGEFVCDKTGRFTKDNLDNTFFQAGEFYRRVLSTEGKNNLINNVAATLKTTLPRIKYREAALFYKADKEMGKRLAYEINIDINKVEKLASMVQEERIYITKDW